MRFEIKSIVLILLFLSCIFKTNAQEKISEFYVASIKEFATDKDIDKARDKAIELAIRKASDSVGIGIDFSFYHFLYSHQIGTKAEQYSGWKIIRRNQGAYKNLIHNSDPTITINENNLVQVEVNINCVLIKYNTKPDPQFVADIRSEPLYKEGEYISFEITSSQDAFLYAFIVDSQKDVFQIFPNNHDTENDIKAKITTVFPEIMRFKLNCEKDLDTEMHDLIFVLLKKDIPFVNTSTLNNLFDWMYSIPLGESVIYYKNFILSKN